MEGPSSWIVKGIPVGLGLGLLWVGSSLLKNEARLLNRRLQLEGALNSKTTFSTIKGAVI